MGTVPAPKRGTSEWTRGESWFKVGRSGKLTTGPRMLLGAYEHTIDDKNRLTLPAKFRQAFADGVVVTRGLDGCLYAFRRPDWDRLVESRLAALDPLRPEGRRLLERGRRGMGVRYGLIAIRPQWKRSVAARPR